MAIPPLNEEGLLPPGIHDCTFEELESVFGQNQWITDTEPGYRRQKLNTQRSKLCERLQAYLEEWRRLEQGVEILVDGSFVTSKPDPNDIDLIVVLPEGWDLTCDPPLQVENLLTKSGLRYSKYPFDLKVAPAGGEPYQRAVRGFEQVRGRPDLSKGLLRVKP
jgi:hypothetical protein